jgi:hypothetical protein
MSAYINRMIQRFEPTGEPVAGHHGALLSPFVRSQSPIAAIDQRLAVDEQLGHGIDGLEPTSVEPEQPVVAATPQPARIQRKAASTTEPSGQPIQSIAPIESAPEGAKTTPSPAALPLDPGSLFGPTPRYFDDPPAPAPTVSPTSPVSPVSPVSTLRGQPTSSDEARPAAVMTPRVATSPDTADALTVASQARVGQEPVIVPKLDPRFVSPVAKSDLQPPWQWLTFETASNVSAAAAPQLVPHPQSPIRVPGEAPVQAPGRAPSTAQLYIVPRPRAHEPLIPEPVERAYTPTSAPSTQRASSPPDRQTAKPTPTPVAQAPRRSAGGKLTIDSISQIGPLDRHFPSRRNFRLRYR